MAEHYVCFVQNGSRMHHFGESIDITDVFQGYANLSEFLLSRMPDGLVMITTMSALYKFAG